MSVTKQIKHRLQQIPRGEPFTTTQLLSLGSRPAIDKALARLVETGAILRIMRGIFVRPAASKYIANPMPAVDQVVAALAESNGETVQVHGAEAAHHFGLSTQVPTQPVYYTSGSSREVRLGKLPVKFIHTNNQQKLQFAGQKPGLALSALWYLGKEAVDEVVVRKIQSRLSTEEFELLRSARKPAWMIEAMQTHYPAPAVA